MNTPLLSVPPAAGRFPLVGHGLALARNPLRFLESLRSSGDIVRVDLGRWPVYVLTTPALVHEALVARTGNLVRGRIYDRARALFGHGLATSEGAFHLRQRRLMQPAFHRRQMGVYVNIILEHARELTHGWRPHQCVAIDDSMHALTLRIVVDSLFRSSLNEAAAAEVQHLMPAIMKGIAVRMATPKCLDRWPIPSNRRFDRAANRLRRLVFEMIASARLRSDRDDGRDSLMALLLAARDADTGEAMTDVQLCDELISVLVAGTETPANTLAWTFHELARYPAVEAKLHAELDSVLADRQMYVDDVARLPYLKQVLNEAMRLHSVLLFTRRVVTDTLLGDVRFPAGTEIAFSPYAIHRDPVFYPDPLRFDPDRWQAECTTQLAAHTFNPFGAGQHKCIGDAFAWTEMSIVIATIARNWRLRPAAGYRVREVLSEVPRPNRLPMIVEPR